MPPCASWTIAFDGDGALSLSRGGQNLKTRLVAIKNGVSPRNTQQQMFDLCLTERAGDSAELLDIQSEAERLTFLCCAADEALTARQVEDLRRALERDYGLELQLLADNPGDTRWYRLAHPGCVRLFSMGEDPDAQSAYLVFLLASE